MTPDLVQFFRQHFPIVRAKCARALGNADDAADVAQEAFLRLCASPVVHQSAAARLKWIYVTGTRLCIDQLRRRRLGIELDAAQADSDSATSGAPPLDAAMAARQELHSLLNVFAPADLEVLVLSRCDQLTQDEVAAALAISSRQVRRILARADAKLAELAGSHR